MTDYTKLGAEIGALVAEKNEAYGSSFAKAGPFLRLLWPTGIPPGREDDALLLVRIFDKQMRIATDRDAFGESPYRDIAGYGLLGAAFHEERGKATCGSASADAEDEPKARPASPPPSAPAPTTTSADAPRPRSSSGGCFPRPVFSSRDAVLQDAFAPSATASAPSEEGDRPNGDTLAEERERWTARNRDGFCAHCAISLDRSYTSMAMPDWGMVTVHGLCVVRFIERARLLGAL